MDIDALFLRFRERGDNAALGAVFDAVAEELLCVALHQTRDDAAAEDLLQATFVVAIERASTWDATRPLRPWLFGILQRELRALRRRRPRAVDARRLPPRRDPGPQQAALAGEATRTVSAAIDRLPQPYRDVVDLHLVRSLTPREVAEHLQRPRGAVRTQLWRGLEMLRGELPKGLALGAAAVALGPPLGRARAHVLAKAGAGAATTSGAVGAAWTGALVMARVWIPVAVLVAVGALWWTWTSPEPDALHRGRTRADLHAQTPPHPVARTEREPTERQQVTASPEEPQQAAASPAEQTTMARLLIVDAHGDPVVDAAVRLYEPNAKAAGAYRRAGPPRLEMRTDANGRTAFPVDRETLLSAHKAGVGTTGDLRVTPDMVELSREWRLVLQPSQRIQGVVLLPDGRPAAEAIVRCHFTSTLYSHLAQTLPPVSTDSRGRFEFKVLPDLDYRLRAELDGHRARGHVDTHSSSDHYEVTLQFPGAFAVHGLLLDAAGAPTAGEVRLLSAQGQLVRRGHANSKGEFELLLTEGGEFILVGGIEGQTAADARVAIDTASPRARITLRLEPFLPITGRLVDEGGAPCGDVLVSASPVADRDALFRNRAALQGIYARTHTAPDGTFRFLVPAGQRYRVGYRATPHMHVSGPEVAPPTDNVVVVMRASDRRGFEVTGRVIAAASGDPVPRYRVYLVTHGSGGGFSDRPLREGGITLGSDGWFRAGPFRPDRRYSLRFEAEGYGCVTSGPFDASVREERVLVSMPAPGSVVCTVMQADGRPAVDARVGLKRTGGTPFEPVHQGRTGADGRLQLHNVSPGKYTVHASAAVRGAGSATGSVMVDAARAASVVVTLRR